MSAAGKQTCSAAGSVRRVGAPLQPHVVEAGGLISRAALSRAVDLRAEGRRSCRRLGARLHALDWADDRPSRGARSTRARRAGKGATRAVRAHTYAEQTWTVHSISHDILSAPYAPARPFAPPLHTGSEANFVGRERRRRGCGLPVRRRHVERLGVIAATTRRPHWVPFAVQAISLMKKNNMQVAIDLRFRSSPAPARRSMRSTSASLGSGCSHADCDHPNKQVAWCLAFQAKRVSSHVI